MQLCIDMLEESIISIAESEEGTVQIKIVIKNIKKLGNRIKKQKALINK